LAIAVVVIPLSALMIVIGELVPKTLGIKHPEWVCLALSPVMRATAWIFYPPVLAFEAITRLIVRLVERRMPASMGKPYEIGLAELRAQTYALRTGRIIGAEQERIILGASNLSTMRVKDIAVAPDEIVMLSADAPLTDHFVIVHLEAYTRFPVTQTPGDPQGIIGYVNLKELIFLAKMFPTNPSLRQITRRLLEISPEAKVGDAFARMMREHVHLALVREEDGAVGGIITLEDILEEVVGDIQDEFDRIPRHITSAGSQWVVGGGATLARLREATARADLGAPEPGEITFTDWARHHHPEPLRGGDTIDIDGARILIRKVRRQRILEALLEFPAP
ncbi:MAG: CNNM domain-containing protein, partial [Planctomycetota bacterium]|nr:CNNM domain-containing protein [Planctomycetota bacterium]